MNEVITLFVFHFLISEKLMRGLSDILILKYVSNIDKK